ncbi:MAG TPA: amino acid ABC transporter permease [Mycobacteriales bacterium]|nr:amino acid ABC transporter permease [Mycobacteriales bacterium]
MTVIPPTSAALPELSDVELWRRDFRRRQGRRSALIAALSSVVVLTALVLGVINSPGWPQVHKTFFDVHYGWSVFPAILRGFWLNVRILVVAEILILLVALLIAAMRTVSGPALFPIRALATIYVDFFRGVPLIVLILLIGFGVPNLHVHWLPKSTLVLGTASLVLAYSAYVAEVFRAGIESVHPSQRAAARSLGLSQSKTLRIVVLPQAVRAVLPPLLNDFVGLQKDVGLVSLLGVVDAVQQATILSDSSFNFTPYTIAALLFVALAIPSGRVADRFAARANRRQRAGAVV